MLNRTIDNCLKAQTKDGATRFVLATYYKVLVEFSAPDSNIVREYYRIEAGRVYLHKSDAMNGDTVRELFAK